MPPEPLPDRAARIEQARSAPAKELKALLHDGDEELLLALLENPEFDQTHAEMMLDRLDLSTQLIGAVARREEWLAAESIRMRLAKHPHTPKRTALAAVKQLFIFDLVKLSQTISAPAEVRRVAEEAILTRIPHLPIGEKLTLARRGPARAAGAILAEGHPQALKLALGNSSLSESQILRVLAKPGVPERVLAAIAQHPKWSCRYNVRVALVRNVAAPEFFVRDTLRHVTLRDLKDLAEMKELPVERRRVIADEVERRSGNPR